MSLMQTGILKGCQLAQSTHGTIRCTWHNLLLVDLATKYQQYQKSQYNNLPCQQWALIVLNVLTFLRNSPCSSIVARFFKAIASAFNESSFLKQS